MERQHMIGIALVILVLVVILCLSKRKECYNCSDKKKESWVPSLFSPKPKVIIPTAKLEAAWTGPTSNPFVGFFQGQLAGGPSDITSLTAATPMQTKDSETAIFKTIL